MPCSSVDMRVRVGVFHPTFIAILTKKAARPKFGSRDYTPFAVWDKCTDFSYRCVISTLCCAIFLVNIKLLSIAEENNWYFEPLFDWCGGSVQYGMSTDKVSLLRSITDASVNSSYATFSSKDLLMLCGDVESNPGPRQSSLRQTRLTSSTTAPPPSPSSEPSKQDIVELLGSIAGSVKEMRQSRQIAMETLSKATASAKDAPAPMEAQQEQSSGDIMSLLQTLNCKFDEMKADLTHLTNMCNIMQKEMCSLNSKLSDLEKENKEIKEENCVLNDKVQSLERKTDNLERQSRQSNLILFGVNRKKNETNVECEQTVRKVLSDKLNISEDILLEKVYRINKSDDSPIMTRFSVLRQKEMILKARHKLKGTNIFISEDFPIGVRETRRKLLPFLSDAKKSGKKATLMYDHLIVNGKKMFLGKDGLLKAY